MSKACLLILGQEKKAAGKYSYRSTAACDKPEHRSLPRKHWFAAIKTQDKIINSIRVKKKW